MKRLQLTKNELWYAEKLMENMKRNTRITIEYDKNSIIKIYKTKGY